MAFSVAIQLFSLRNDLESDPRATLTAIKEMGYDGVEAHGFLEEKELAIIKELGLKIPSGHISLETLWEKTEYTFEFFKNVGAKYLVIPYMFPDNLPNEKNYEATVEKLKVLAEKAKDYGITLCYHNHESEFKKLDDGKYVIERVLSDVGNDNFGAQYDTAWMSVMGADAAAYIRSNPDTAKVIHLKDYYRHIDDDKRPEMRPVGYGVMDIPRILDASKEVGCDWIIVEQDSPSLDKSALECAKLSIDYIRTIVNYGK